MEISKQEELRARRKRFARRIIRLFRSLPHSPDAEGLGKQLLRSGTSVGAIIKAAGRARSQSEFRARIGIVLEEADEVVFWLECLVDSGIAKEELLTDLLKEANDLVAIFAASYQTARR
jgi:four helix bundle protein